MEHTIKSISDQPAHGSVFFLFLHIVLLKCISWM